MKVGWLGQIWRKTEFEIEAGEWLEEYFRKLWACFGDKLSWEVAKGTGVSQLSTATRNSQLSQQLASTAFI